MCSRLIPLLVSPGCSVQRTYLHLPLELDGRPLCSLCLQAIGSVIPESAGSAAWLQSGQELQEAGQKEVNDAKRRQASEAVVDSGAAKLKRWVVNLCSTIHQASKRGREEDELAGGLATEHVPSRSAQECRGRAFSLTASTLLQPLLPGLPQTSQLTHISAAGYLTGDQDLQNRGNTEAEAAQWKFKQGMSNDVLAVPVPSAEGVKGKVESVVGMVTGDQGKQLEGNKRAEKAAWTDGV